MINITPSQLMKTIGCFLFISASSSVSAAVPSSDCMSINSDVNFIEKSLSDAPYRFALSVEEANIPEFNYDSSHSFDEYLLYINELIKVKNPKAGMSCPIVTVTTEILNREPKELTVRDLVAPFELKQDNNNKAILLIHGLTDSPYMYHDLSGFFHQQGFTVRTILLPGHGTAPSDLLDVEYQQWQQATKYAIDRTVADFEHVYLGGFSTGGALIFDYLMQKSEVSDKIEGLIMWSPAYRVFSEQAHLAQYVDYIPFIDWLDKDADIDFAKYESFPYNAAAQIYLLTTLIDEDTDQKRNFHDIPLLTIVSEHDQTVNTSATLSLVKQWHDEKEDKKASNDHVIYYGDQPSFNLPDTVTLSQQKCHDSGECQSIYGMSHSAVMFSEGNLHYGAKGSYKNCGHYLSDKTKYIACKTNQNLPAGEITPENLAAISLFKRLTFNPHYSSMISTVKTFLSSTQSD